MVKNKFMLILIFCSYAGSSFAADSVKTVKPAMAKICSNCHKAESNVIRGYFDNVAFKSKTIQVKIDETVELVKFDEDEIKVVNGAGKSGDGDFLKDNRVRKGHEISIEYAEKDGIKTALKLTEKPPVKIPAEMLISTSEVEKLVATGGEKSYYLFDSRPLPRFQEGSIPTAVNLPYPQFDKMIDKLPKDKSALVIFYCAGPSCNMSPGSADKARKLGYSNLKVYKDGMPAWLEKNYGVLSNKFFKEAWIDKDIPHVLLDVRTEDQSAQGHISGAVSFPLIDGLPVKNLALKQKKAPIMIYDEKGGKDGETAARSLIKAGYGRVVILGGGFDAWQKAGFTVSKGKLSLNATYSPKLRPGELTLPDFSKLLSTPSSDVMIMDVRNIDEVNAGMLPAATLIPVEEIKSRVAEIPRDKRIITYCSTGVRAEMAYHTLKELGYSNIGFVNAKIDFEKGGSYKITVD